MFMDGFALSTPDGKFEPDAAEFLTQSGYEYRDFPAASIPTIDALNESRRSTLLATGDYPRTYEELRIFLGLKTWPRVLIISNAESLSADQALNLRGCLNELESDRPTERMQSLCLLLKYGCFLSKDLDKFVTIAIPNGDPT
jgi:hypothetical protein